MTVAPPPTASTVAPRSSMGHVRGSRWYSDAYAVSCLPLLGLLDAARRDVFLDALGVAVGRWPCHVQGSGLTRCNARRQGVLGRCHDGNSSYSYSARLAD